MDREHRFRILYRDHQPDVLAYFLRRLDREDAVESTADVFLTLWRRLDEIPDGQDSRLWLFGVAHNALRNRRRSIRRRRRLTARYASVGSPNPPPLPEVVVVRWAEDDAAIAALEQVGAADRELLTLRLWEEASFDDIAEIVGCSRHAAEQRYARALRRLRSVWDGAGHVPVRGTYRSLRRQERTRET